MTPKEAQMMNAALPRCRSYGPELTENEQVIVLQGERIENLEAVLRSVNATMRAIIKRNQGGYIGDWDAIHHTVEVIDAALRPDAEGNSKIGSAPKTTVKP